MTTGRDVYTEEGILIVKDLGPLLWAPGYDPDSSVAPLSIIGDADVEAIGQALSARPGFRIHIVDKPAEQVIDYHALADEPEVTIKSLGGGVLEFEVATYLTPGTYPAPARIDDLIAPLLKDYETTAEIRVDEDETDWGGMHRVSAVCGPSWDSRPLTDFYRLGVALAALIDATSGSALSLTTTEALLRAGFIETILGLPESAWFDAKEYDYAPGNKRPFEIAKDVAAFANADGGLIVIGLGTSTSAGTEIVSKLTPLPKGSFDVKRIFDSVSAHVYPTIHGLDAFVVPRDGDEFAVVVVPIQLPNTVPFVVHGHDSGNGISNNFFSIPYRSGAHTQFWPPSKLHSYIAAGRQVLEPKAETSVSNPQKGDNGAQ